MAAAGGGGIVRSLFGLVGRGTGGFFSLISVAVKKVLGFNVPVMLLIVLLFLHQNIIASVRERSAEPFIKAVGEKVLGADKDNKVKTDEILSGNFGTVTEKGNGIFANIVRFFQRMSNLFAIFRNTYFLFFLFVVFYNVSMWFLTMNDSNKTGTFVGALILFWFVMTLYGFITYNPAMYGNRSFLELPFGTQFYITFPLSGTLYFLLHIGTILKTIFGVGVINSISSTTPSSTAMVSNNTSMVVF